MYLLDTNILLEVLLRQERIGEVKRFLDATSSDQLYVTDFSIYSIGIMLVREKRAQAFTTFVRETVADGSVRVIAMPARDLGLVVDVAEKYRFDFDDAYQYVVAERHDLIIVSFDSHFDRTERGRKTPVELMQP